MCESPLRALFETGRAIPHLGDILAASFELAKEIVVAWYQLTIKQKNLAQLEEACRSNFWSSALGSGLTAAKIDQASAKDALLDDRVIYHLTAWSAPCRDT
jgi:hypothetical protein